MVKASYICTIVEAEGSKFAHSRTDQEERSGGVVSKSFYLNRLRTRHSAVSTCTEIAKHMSTKTEVPDCERGSSPT